MKQGKKGTGARKVAVVIGTRPEAIKLAPVVRELGRARVASLKPLVVLTAQHREMADEVLEVFRIRPAYDLNVMRHDQSLFQVTTAILGGLEEVFRRERPCAVLVQGDTTSTMAGALAAFYLSIKVGHVEAGLRTYDRRNPFPEEMNRRLTSVLADYHFAPTERARRALLDEGVPTGRVYLTGNPVVDALRAIVRRRPTAAHPLLRRLPLTGRRLILVTAHRRENWGRPLGELCRALIDIIDAVKDTAVVFPVHPNPNVRRTVDRLLSEKRRIHLLPPLDYLTFVRLMARSTLIITDSGGVQEEAPSVKVPALVVRKKSERPEGVEAGMVRLVGTGRRLLVEEAVKLLRSEKERLRMTSGVNPYGDGRAARRIVEILARECC